MSNFHPPLEVVGHGRGCFLMCAFRVNLFKRLASIFIYTLFDKLTRLTRTPALQREVMDPEI